MTFQYAHVLAERQDEVVYYDTFETADDITEDDTAEREELRRLQVSARQLEARRGRITSKRSYLRNKRVCVLYALLFSFWKFTVKSKAVHAGQYYTCMIYFIWLDLKKQAELF